MTKWHQNGMKKLFTLRHDDDACLYLNNKCIQPCVCERDSSNNITKIFTSQDVFEWESHVYMSLVDSNLFPPVSPLPDKRLTYMIGDMVSLRTYIKTTKHRMSLVLNELFSYICTFKEHKFLHGNLHIDNVYVNPKSFDNTPHFFVIDYANSYVLKYRHSTPQYKRTSFMGEYDTKLQDPNFVFWDFLTMYSSLKLHFKGDHKNLRVLENVICTFVKEDKLISLLKTYQEPRYTLNDCKSLNGSGFY